MHNQLSLINVAGSNPAPDLQHLAYEYEWVVQIATNLHPGCLLIFEIDFLFSDKALDCVQKFPLRLLVKTGKIPVPQSESANASDLLTNPHWPQQSYISIVMEEKSTGRRGDICLLWMITVPDSMASIF